MYTKFILMQRLYYSDKNIVMVLVTIDGVWIGNQFYRMLTTRNYK
jgi:hypothetical protein